MRAASGARRSRAIGVSPTTMRAGQRHEKKPDKFAASGDDAGLRSVLEMLGLQQERTRILESFRSELSAIRSFF